MSATMARQGGQLQLEQSNMRVALNMAKMAKGGYLCTTREETKQTTNKPQAEVWEEKKQGVVSPGIDNVQGAIESYPQSGIGREGGRCHW